ncbi:MAG: UDP-glucose/GDP-mannose dehydrogenase family protein [Bacteroidales bacterium]
MKVTVIGTGYVGLVTGTCFAETGADVICVDIDPSKIAILNNGGIPIYEPGLEPLIKNNREKGRLVFTTSFEQGITDCDLLFIAVGTPPGENGSADLSHVLDVASRIGKEIDHYMVIITKSTVPVGTSEKVKDVIRNEIDKRGVDVEFDIASNPEFLKEGDAVNDFLRPDRIVIGVESERAEEMLKKLYKPFLLNQHPVMVMDIRSSELTKYAANSMLATRISFMNEMANLCDIIGADINMVRMGIGSDKRIGSKFIYPGIGYGGACFPKDVKALVRTGMEYGYDLEILKSVDSVNDRQKRVMFAKIKEHFKNLNGLRFAFWGLSFKPQTDDVREAPSLVLISLLLEAGAEVAAYDPAAIEETKKVLGNSIAYAHDPYSALTGADALVLATEWPEFRLPDISRISEMMKGNVIFDGRNIYDPEEIRASGFVYYGIGRP